jgi:hypothetical protein
MKIDEFVTEQDLQDLDEKASKKLCTSSKPNSALGASNLSSCKAQGLRARESNKKVWVAGKHIPVSGKKVKSTKYGGTVKNYND